MKRRDKLISRKHGRSIMASERRPSPEHLAKWLNFNPGGELEELLLVAQQLDGLRRQNGGFPIAKQLCRKFSRMLRKYQMFYYVLLDTDENCHLQFPYVMSGFGDIDALRPDPENINTILYMLERGRLDRIRKCEQCKQWIAARVMDQKFCSKECRQQNFESKPDVRERRKAARRERYHFERYVEAQSKKLTEIELGTTYKRRSA